MEIAKRFIEKKLQGRTSESRDTLVAISASLASHIGVFLILTTAAALSTEVKLWYPPVLHVDLVSMSTAKVSRTLFDAGKMENIDQQIKNRSFEPAAGVSVDKKEKNNVQTQAATAPVVASRSVNVAAPATVTKTGAEAKEAKRASENDISRHVQLASIAPSSERISLAVPRYRDNGHPNYPWVARTRGYEGVVLLSAEVYADGKVGSLKLKKSSGFAVLDRAALDAVKTWKFDPGKKMGKPISMWVDVPVRFVLNNSASL